MEAFQRYLARIPDASQRARIRDILAWVHQQFPRLTAQLCWNQPVFTSRGTFIVGFGRSRQGWSVFPERQAVFRFHAELLQAGLPHTWEQICIPWEAAVNFQLLHDIIRFNLTDKAGCRTFWRCAETQGAAFHV